MRGSLVYLIPIALVLILVVVLSQKTKPQTSGESVAVTPSPINVLSSPSVSPSPSSTPEIMQKSAEPSSSPSSGSSEIMDWRYPQSTVTSESDTRLELKSSDDPQKITDWYKSKITALGMSIKTFVTTTNNGNVLNKLSGASGGKTISVEIKRVADSSNTTISVSI